MPDGAALGRTEQVLDDVATRARAVPGVTETIAIAGVSPLDNNATLVNAGVVYAILEDWAQRPRGSGKDLLPL